MSHTDSEYQVFARRYRPQTFKEVIAQDAIVTTLKNAMMQKRLAHAYLFCGSRGTGKTTLARIFAKALNCESPIDGCEPCNTCRSCREISSGSSLEVLEIDGASNRGIDDIRQINETVGYTTASGSYKIYIIDEVHMLTKEAFNALLKTLEEPPKKVKFFFATTEPHKVLPTILSRCQRFNLNRIPSELIIEKLKRIVEEQGASIEEEALRIIAGRAQGGLRDAESLLDQIVAFHSGEAITANTVASILGVMPTEIFFALDKAADEGNLAFAFEVAERIFSEGKDLSHFVEMYTEHFRNLLAIQLSGPDAANLDLSEEEKKRYMESAKIYRKEQCLENLDYLIKEQQSLRFAPSSRIALEALLLHVMRSRYQVPVDLIVEKLTALEKQLPRGGTVPPQQEAPAPLPAAPTPSPAPAPKKKEAPKKEEAKESLQEPLYQQYHYDTLLQFAGVELDALVEKKSYYKRK